MKAIGESGSYFLRLDPGEELVGTVLGFVSAEGIDGGAVTGIGTVSSATLGYFDRERREYSKRVFSGDLELVSLVGNLAFAEGAPILHAHVVLSGRGFETYGGHLFDAVVAATCELALSTRAPRLERVRDEGTGLMLVAGPGEPRR
jgi:predicted DNA-binding protein with PD1-like motif